MTARLPDFLIVGAARCGTSWLAKNLAAHPEVFIPPYKEVHFFDRYYSKGSDWYRACFAGRPERLVGEATPAYLYFEGVPELVRRHVPDAKIIAILRHPVERAFSHHANLVAKARAKNRDYIAMFEVRIRTQPRLIDEGFYSKKLERYYERFPVENIKVILNDDLVKESCGVLQEIYCFLGIDNNVESILTHGKINSAEAKLEESRFLSRLHRLLTRVGLRRLSRLIEERNKILLQPMNEDTRTMLIRRYYLEEIERLERLLDRDLGSWKH